MGQLLPHLPRYCISLPFGHFGFTLNTRPLKMVNKDIHVEENIILKVVTL
jgi:hypothetical protein